MKNLLFTLLAFLIAVPVINAQSVEQLKPLGTSSDNYSELLIAKTKKKRSSKQSTGKATYVGNWKNVNRGEGWNDRYMSVEKDSDGDFCATLYYVGRNHDYVQVYGPVVGNPYGNGMHFDFTGYQGGEDFSICVYIQNKNKIVESDIVYDLFGNSWDKVTDVWTRISTIPEDLKSLSSEKPLYIAY
ncbi:MAG: hypothetical protein IJP59_09115 [Muribaculaceae bacterium]|nr:hypothetical protein [Muribaculaceae bacterium]